MQQNLNQLLVNLLQSDLEFVKESNLSSKILIRQLVEPDFVHGIEFIARVLSHPRL